MTDPEKNEAEPGADSGPPGSQASEPSSSPSTPFDSPYFIPVLLWAGALWFGYDGWFNPEMEWVNFNRYGFAVLVVLAVYFTWKALREKRAERESGPSSGSSAGE